MMDNTNCTVNIIYVSLFPSLKPRVDVKFPKLTPEHTHSLREVSPPSPTLRSKRRQIYESKHFKEENYICVHFHYSSGTQ